MIVNRENAYHYRWGKNCDGWVYLATDALLVIEERMPPDTAEHRHHHQRAKQLFVVQHGELVIEVEGQWHRLTSGDSLTVEPGQHHTAMNQGTADVVFLNISSPSAHGDRVNDEPANSACTGDHLP